MLGDSPALKAAIRVFGLQGPVGRGPLWRLTSPVGYYPAAGDTFHSHQRVSDGYQGVVSPCPQAAATCGGGR